MKNEKYFDFLVIGSGIAGLNFALEASRYGTVAIVTKKELMESNSNYAQGGIAAVLDKHDSFESHVEDTLKAGCYLNDKKAVEIMVEDAPKEIEKLINIGVGFNRQGNELCLTQEGGHSARRIAHVRDATGREIERALLHQVRHNENIKTFESHIAFELINERRTTNDEQCVGALVFDDEKKQVKTFFAKATILATGGAGQVYSRNCNPKIATGDGVAIASRAGAKIQDMEFVQFHPTALDKKDCPAFLISETVRGEGGILKNKKGEEFMASYHELKELAPRDIVSRAIFEELKNGQVYLDIRHKGSEFIKKRFPYIYEQLWWYGIKMDKDLIPVAPAAHYVCGGVHTNIEGETNIKGLYAFGEVARTGVHGANRLASNSLLECLVFSSRALESAKTYIENLSPYLPISISPNSRDREIGDKRYQLDEIERLKHEIQKLMWQNVGIVREETKMEETLSELETMEKEIEKFYNEGINREILELKNLHTVAVLITKAALERKESIGCHFIKK